jgi:hypothetical protein
LTLASLKPTLEVDTPSNFTIDLSVLIRGISLLIGIILMFVAYDLFDDNLFTTFNVLVWVVAILFVMGALWDYKGGSLFGWLKIRFNGWTLLLIAATALVFFFRFYQTASVPPEPFSDHAEKIFDVYDVSQGETRIFFPRNTGREGFQMYWTLLIAKVFGTGLSYLSLKLGTAILGPSTIVSKDNKSMVLYIWYDNEYGYSRQVIRLAKHLAKVIRLTYY